MALQCACNEVSSFEENTRVYGLVASDSSSEKKSLLSFIYDEKCVTGAPWVNNFGSSRIKWAFDPAYPKELTLARRNGTFGHGIAVLVARILRVWKSTRTIRILTVECTM